MDEENCALAARIISKSYAQQGAQALSKHRKLIKTLLSQRRLPQEGWDESTIELFLKEVSLMDSNNFLGNVGVGEREARVACPIVARRHFGFAHGVGRSGDLTAEQPKAAGSSLLAILTNTLAADALKIAGIADIGPTIVLPSATGIAITLSLLALRSTLPSTARYVLWTRIDQKTCLKCIVAAGFEPLVIPMKLNGDQLETDMDALTSKITELQPHGTIACVLSTTSCFAPRAPDNIVSIAKLCAQHNVPHIINNAYGIQSTDLCTAITSAWRKGRVDGVIQSTDKNFMVPVGGAIVIAPKSRPELVETLNSIYPGRASASPMLDLLITLLHWGVAGWQQQLHAREQLLVYTKNRLEEFAVAHGERVLYTPSNPISLGMTLSHTAASRHIGGGSTNSTGSHIGMDTSSSKTHVGSVTDVDVGEEEEASRDNSSNGNTKQKAATVAAKKNITFLGSMLYTRFASGARVVARGKQQQVAGIEFTGYGAHCDDYHEDYITVAAALGTSESDVDEFLKRLGSCMKEY